MSPMSNMDSYPDATPFPRLAKSYGMASSLVTREKYGKCPSYMSTPLLTEKQQSVFRFTDTDLKRISNNLKQHEEGLTKVLKETMPGLVHSNTSDNLRDSILSPTSTIGASTSASNLTLPTDDRMLTGMDQHHRVLIKPDTFNVTVLFQPTLAFLDRVVNVLPTGIDSAKASSGVLDDFVLKVYLPQLEEKVLDLFHAAVAGTLRICLFPPYTDPIPLGPESFQPDPLSTNLSSEPLIKVISFIYFKHFTDVTYV